jgi:diaminohydroxyphosphoribosylaminopyrimidine deaminase/5-amino-6-(5-phosphoribosylamino)uracil reductase
MEIREPYMMRALELAGLGLGFVSPNPLVGCVIAHEDHIIGEGYHHKYGESHAEVNAINSVKDKSLLEQAILYVTLEPCNHFGKTPPCTELIKKHKIPKIAVCNIDPNPIVAGKGMENLRNSGVEVVTGILEKEGNELNKRFFTYHRKHRPYIILKWAQTTDGFIAGKNYKQIQISNDFSRKLVHKWRSEEDAILVGYNTALHDNPKLNVRDWQGMDPVRIVVDEQNKLPKDLNLFDNTQRTIVISGKSSVPEIIKEIYSEKILSVIIEGGTKTLQKFIDAGIWDEARIFTAPKLLGEGIKAPDLFTNASKAASFEKIEREDIFEDELKCYLKNL